jgi:hypothetical protein
LREAERYWTLWFDECIESDVRATNAEAALAEAQKEIERLRKDPSETLSEHPGCVYCMEAGTPVKDGEVCPKCGDRLPTKLERKQAAQLIDLRKVDRFWFIDLAFGPA